MNDILYGNCKLSTRVTVGWNPRCLGWEQTREQAVMKLQTPLKAIFKPRVRFSIFWRTTLFHSEPLVTTLPPFVPRDARPRVLSLLRRQVFPESARAVYPAVVQYAG